MYHSGAVRKNPVATTATDAVIETALADWLKYARERDSKRRRKTEEEAGF